ncbi:DNA mismatch repair protein MSH6 [Histomonas meleagridis]|uniref:DNA mismatch repair protein MSH6 n=1 Tax=Histomonas meleagridis TaxID=135588 RepID=UPI00355AAC2E|nr:DNA mismatch repair protein MSH6 [Histomonas meleagridis]KAH0799936.1 DNA mismatch repair protein MSH6 [Histomonas meleagridis]
MQSSLFQFFSPKKSTTPSTSPVAKKANAIRTLKRVSKIANDDLDFELDQDFLSDELEDEDEKEFDKVVTAKKIKKSNKAAEKAKTPNSTFISAPKTPKAQPSKSDSKSPLISPSSSMENLRITAEDEVELPDWLTTNLRDANKRRPSDPDYDPTTVYIPPKARDSFTPFQKQFWEIKEHNFDAIVMIRKGKFYEMFSVDAIFARDVLKLKLTSRGKEPMCGVPDKAFSEWAIKLINNGKRVCKVEQMETAIDQKNRKGQKAIKRELVQIYSIGTIDDFEMLESTQPSYLMSLRSFGRNIAGICLVDCSIGSFHLGIVSEEDLSDLLIRFEPVEVIYDKETICPEHLDIVKKLCGNSCAHAKSGVQWWDGQLAMNEIQKVASWDNIPEKLQEFPKEAIAAFGGCVLYLTEHKIAKSLLSLQRFSSLNEAGGTRYLSLDSSALSNLQIIGKDEHCLLTILDRCSTPFGKRRLRFWIMHPLRNIKSIEQRLDSVEELMDPKFSTLPKSLQILPDLERILTRVYSNRCSVKIFLECLNSLIKASDILTAYEDKVHTSQLTLLLPVGKGKAAHKQIETYIESLDLKKSTESNEFVVKPGIFEDIDEIDQQIKTVEDELNEQLQKIRRELRCKDIEFVHQLSERYQVSIPNKVASSVDDRFILVSQTKGVKRYRTPEINQLISKLENLENERLKLRSGCQKRFIDQFASKSELWDSILESISEIDCLYSLSMASQRWEGTSCRPKFVTKESEEAKGHSLLSVKQMRHPCIPGRCCPNDIDIGDKNVIIVTGPNTSGKSTYARMCCVAIILAQIGCYLPADSATLTIFDQIFTRIGAGDRLFSGQSTYSVELSETGRLMRNSTEDSFVVLDELGRGTSTFDGIAIATAVLEEFIENIRCPLVFCTHYHILTQQFKDYPMVRNASMQYKIGDTLTLLYRLINVPCSSSFGCAVAKMCGIPKEITDEAQKVADDFEARHKALHIIGEEKKVEVKEAKPELKKLVEEFKAAASKGSSAEKFVKLLPLLDAVRNIDLN